MPSTISTRSLQESHCWTVVPHPQQRRSDGMPNEHIRFLISNHVQPWFSTFDILVWMIIDNHIECHILVVYCSGCWLPRRLQWPSKGCECRIPSFPQKEMQIVSGYGHAIQRNISNQVTQHDVDFQMSHNGSITLFTIAFSKKKS